MIKLTMSVCIDADKGKVWKMLSQIEKITLWVEPIISAYCEGEINKGIGTVRVCNLKNNISIKEKWTKWDEGNSFTYEGYDIPMVKNAKNTWSVKSIKGKTLLTTESEVELKGGFLGKCLEPLMRFMSKKMGNESLAALRYLVENGKPYNGKISRLPEFPAIC